MREWVRSQRTPSASQSELSLFTKVIAVQLFSVTDCKTVSIGNLRWLSAEFSHGRRFRQRGRPVVGGRGSQWEAFDWVGKQKALSEDATFDGRLRVSKGPKDACGMVVALRDKDVVRLAVGVCCSGHCCDECLCRDNWTPNATQFRTRRALASPRPMVLSSRPTSARDGGEWVACCGCFLCRSSKVRWIGAMWRMSTPPRASTQCADSSGLVSFAVFLYLSLIGFCCRIIFASIIMMLILPFNFYLVFLILYS